ncbi:hypothetical protein [Streptomyces sp. NPDC101393]|uniref:hypothetical protein n=1 Tax=Streptomyces sp. NPDC101393 TaxID=3366141 RepID=UPI003806620C
MPGSATAAGGDFRYTYRDRDGTEGTVTLHDPESGKCLTLPEAAVEYTQPPAHSPRNRTDATAAVFTHADCSGEVFRLRPHTGGGSARMKLRSVIFS